MPKFSIITVCKNTEQSIERTIQSVIEQNFKNYEYLIIDGKSTDNTLQIIKRYGKYVTKLVSEADTGIYAAMNKGIKMASGEYLFFLNAGDVFLHNNVLSIVGEQIGKNIVDIFYGHVLVLDKKTGKAHINEQCPYLNKLAAFKCVVAHQAAFIKKEMFDKNGLHDASLRIFGDYEWFLRVLGKGRFKYYNFVCAVYALGGVSSDKEPEALRKHKQEREMVQRMYYNRLEWFVYSNEFLYKKLFFLDMCLCKVYRNIQRVFYKRN